MKIDKEDNPRHQLVGPISALLILHKHRSALSNILPANVNDCILDLLFDHKCINLKDKIISAVSAINNEAGSIINEAFIISHALTAQQKMRAFEYMNSMLQVDISLIRTLSPEFVDLPAKYRIEIALWYAQRSVREELRKLTPIASPRLEQIFRHYQIYASAEEWKVYVQCYGSFYGYNYSDYQAYCENNYCSYQSYNSSYTYVEPHHGYDPVEENIVLLKDYLHQVLDSRSGICGWKYKPGHKLSDTQIHRIVEHASREIPVSNEHLFSFTEWGMFTLQGPRSLDQQLICSMSEVSKSDKSIIPKLMG